MAAQRDEARISAFVEHLGATLESSGMPRIASRVFVLLMTAPDGSMTAAEIGDALRVSPAAVSSAVSYLNQIGLTVRMRAPGRRCEVHKLVADDWYTSFANRGGILTVMARLASEGAEAVGGPDTPAGRRLWLDAQLFSFLENRFNKVLEEWSTHRAELDAARGPVSNS